jgi:UDP-glucose 4-epimerase
LGHGANQADLPLVGYINGEIEAGNLSTLVARFGRPDVVMHLAGGSSVLPSIVAPAEDFARTVATSVRLLDWVRLDLPEAAVVLASSAAVYGNAHSGPIPEHAPRAPLSPYGYHKAMMEQVGECWASSFGLRVATVRLFSVYGPQLRKQLIWELCLQLARGVEVITLGGTGHETRDWVHIEDAAAILIGAADHAAPTAPVFNGCTGHGVTVAEAARLVAKGFEQEVEFRFTGDRRAGDPVHLVGRPERAAATGLRAGIDADTGLVAAARAARSQLAHP